MVILIFFVVHWYLSAFCQTFFLHRYGAHKMFTMPPFWEKFFYFLTFLSQGSSYLNPRAYAVMHRMHHAHSDTAEDPHSPLYTKDPARMMFKTLVTYLNIQSGKLKPDAEFEGDYPVWAALDRVVDGLPVRLLFIAGYFLFYWHFATAWWQWLLFPVTVVVGPVHGAIVNWCGHKYGYANFDNRDRSRNTFFCDVLTMGELMQNNHHHATTRSNFSARWFEIDPTYPFIRLFSSFGIIKIDP